MSDELQADDTTEEEAPDTHSAPAVTPRLGADLYLRRIAHADGEESLICQHLFEITFKAAKAALVEDFEREYLRRLLHLAGGNVSRAARVARIDRKYLDTLLRARGLRKSR